MSKKEPKYLRNRKTGVVFPYNERMAAMDIMEPTDKLPKRENTKPGLRQATFPKPKEQREAEAEEEAKEQAKEQAKVEKIAEEKELAGEGSLDEVYAKLKSEVSKKGVIEVAREYLGVNIEIKDDKGNDRKLADLKNEVVAILNERTGN